MYIVHRIKNQFFCREKKTTYFVQEHSNKKQEASASAHMWMFDKRSVWTHKKPFILRNYWISYIDFEFRCTLNFDFSFMPRVKFCSLRFILSLFLCKNLIFSLHFSFIYAESAFVPLLFTVYWFDGLTLNHFMAFLFLFYMKWEKHEEIFIYNVIETDHIFNTSKFFGGQLINVHNSISNEHRTNKIHNYNR